jgi:two-component sensor histidine kinase
MVKVEGEAQPVLVPVSSKKPGIPEAAIERWQKIVDLVAEIMGVPSGLITRLTESDLEIVVASGDSRNPYKRNDHDKLGIGMYCETVAGRRSELRVNDSSSSSYWETNPHAGLGMRAYLGVPILWEDGELFGTFCMLSDKANSFQDDYVRLLRQFKEIIENDLRYLLVRSEFEERLSVQELRLREVNHRLKNQLNILISYISIQANASPSSEARAVLQEVRHRVFAVSMIHESVSKSSAAETLELGDYLSRLCEFILEDLVAGEISVTYRIERIELPAEKAISLALIVSELITNSVKHAFPGGGEKRISIEARREGGGALALTYRDNGVGFPEGFDAESAQSLGFLILGNLVKQLDGKMALINEDGTRIDFLLHP